MAERKIKTVLVDLSGTIHIEDEEIPGSINAVQKLQNSGLNVRFVTNTTKESQNVLYNRLKSIGFSIDKADIFTSLSAARKLIKEKSLRPFLMVDQRAMEDFEGLSSDNPDSVVIGLAPDCFNYKDMNKAFKLLVDGRPLIAIHKARYFKRKDGLALGPGPFVSALEYASDVKALVVGKPEKTFFHSAIDGFDCKPEECVMIGDDARDDVGGAQNAGMLGILVKTGKYRDGDESKFDPTPFRTESNFEAAVDFILEKLK